MKASQLADPFLLAHIIRPRIFDIGGKLSPVSIRDQMVRGRMFIDRACEVGLISPEASIPVLVVGAGAAGATVAIYAAQKRIKTLLIDAARAPFLRQRLCRTRWVDPAQYDWPVEHWDSGVYPWALPRMPLPWSAGISHQFAIGWTAELNRQCKIHQSHLRVRYRTTITPGSKPRRIRGGLDVDLQGPRGRRTDRFALIISCVGFGAENCRVNTKYKGFDFWETDPFEKHNVGVRLGPAKVLISGGGDGALQDFLRVVTTAILARDIYSSLRIPPSIASQIQSAEDQAQRAFVWGNNSVHDHPIYTVLESSHRSAVDELWSNNLIRNQVINTFDDWVKDPLPDVELAFPCDHFSKCYGLNQFLVRLLVKYLKERRDMPCLRPQTKVVKVTEHGKHRKPPAKCNNDPRHCHGQDHDVWFDTSTCEGGDSNSPFIGKHVYNVVIIRHGIVPPVLLYKGTTRLSNPRQILPYHVAS